MVDTIERNQQLLHAIQADDYAGYDPFDMLNSRIFRATPLYKSSLLRLAVLQFGKKSPINFRKLLLVPKARNPKAVAICVLGLVEDFRRTGEAIYIDEALRLGQWLIENRSDPAEWHNACWGYHFDWQARAFYVPRGKPNIITTVYVAKALLALGEASGITALSDYAVDAANFIRQHLYIPNGGEPYFAYIPGEKALVHNASLWGAAWCSVAARICGDNDLQEMAHAVATTSAVAQSDDGSWEYGAASHHRFVDGFHTGYNIEALDLLRTQTGIRDFDEAIRAGFSYYKNNFFTEEGIAKYYNNNVYPIDMHSFAQAILVFLKIDGYRKNSQIIDGMIEWAYRNMLSRKTDMFFYQKLKLYTNKVQYIRWTQAWMYYSIACYNRHLDSK
ncbi:hypothetical protein [Sphingorhabdus sp.]|uniref:hypothetical protein n=2 Tax=Sphingorhabdus sp. TaxID=1902408 RepID=UPI0032B76A81